MEWSVQKNIIAHDRTINDNIQSQSILIVYADDYNTNSMLKTLLQARLAAMDHYGLQEIKHGARITSLTVNLVACRTCLQNEPGNMMGSDRGSGDREAAFWIRFLLYLSIFYLFFFWFPYILVILCVSGCLFGGLNLYFAFRYLFKASHLPKQDQTSLVSSRLNVHARQPATSLTSDMFFILTQP